MAGYSTAAITTSSRAWVGAVTVGTMRSWSRSLAVWRKPATARQFETSRAAAKPAGSKTTSVSTVFPRVRVFLGNLR